MPPPTNIRALQDQRILEIHWSPDHVGRYPYRYLRANCPCAGCIHEMTGQRLLDPGAIPADLTLEDMQLVGSYAVQFRWSDGHSTGVYTYDHLARLCPCDRCTPPGPRP